MSFVQVIGNAAERQVIIRTIINSNSVFTKL